MIDVRVIAAQGATLRGPALLRLTTAQHAARAHVLGKSKKGLCKLDGGAEINLKCGEVFGMEVGEGRLNEALFEIIVEAEVTSPIGDESTLAGGAAE
jgi:hypothetical protein